MNAMARIGLLLMIAIFLIAGCTTVKGKILLIDFDGISKSYQQVMLDSDFETAQTYSNTSTVVDKVDLAAYKNVKIVEYRVKKGHISNENNEIKQIAEVKYYRSDDLVVRTILDEQLWQYDDINKTWILQTPLPEFE